MRNVTSFQCGLSFLVFLFPFSLRKTQIPHFCGVCVSRRAYSVSSGSSSVTVCLTVPVVSA